jgi:hypothetical protein
MTATRRLAAITAIDVAGYSRLTGEDEARTHGLCTLDSARATVRYPP